MPDAELKPALRAALRDHEIGRDTPYRLCFAGKGKSGASFGFMQGDLAGKQPVVQATFRKILQAAGTPPAAIGSLVARLSAPLIKNPLGSAETAMVDAALQAGKADVDAMDEAILRDLYASLDTCLSHAHATGRSIDAEALIMMALWINMTGPPTDLLLWLSGDDPKLHAKVPTAPQTVDGRATLAYMSATDYFTENTKNLQHFQDSTKVGLAALGAAGTPVAAAPAPAAPAVALPDNGFVYEQATGRMFERTGGRNDLLATGYSGSQAGGGKNNPHAQDQHDIGPIPRGRYAIGQPVDHPTALSLPLTPDPANIMFGRDAFFIHGDAVAAPGTASHGCIILEKHARQTIDADRVGPLIVVERLG